MPALWRMVALYAGVGADPVGWEMVGQRGGKLPFRLTASPAGSRKYQQEMLIPALWRMVSSSAGELMAAVK